MCGLIFSYYPGLDADGLLDLANRSLNTIAHRGPDDKGLWVEPPVIVGHRRLSIIDVSGSRQPMMDPYKRYILTYNGEIYNFKELRQEIGSRWNFKTSGDTEVVLAGLVLEGDAFLNRMEGMWALALWDHQDKTLLISRDRMGKKPLYYQTNTYGFSCASELNALAHLSTAPWQEDLDSTADYLRYGYYLPGTTAYKNIYEVLPGHFLKWRPDSNPEQFQFWSLPLEQFQGTKKAACKLLRTSLVHAVEKRLVADVEVGAFLSGGVDSSLIVAILTKMLGVQPKTFTIGFAEKSYDEKKYARQVALLYGTDHFEREFKNWDKDTLISLVLDHVGQPFSDASLLPTAMVSELASNQLKVVLSGDGADELFSGYQRYQARTLLRWYTRLPKSIKNNTERLVKLIPEPMAHHSHSILKKAHLFLDIANQQEDTPPYVAPVLYAYRDFQTLAPDLIDRGHSPPNLPSEACEDSLQEMMAADTLVYLPQDILTKVDRASMAHSLEARTPFLDRAVVELAFSLPRKWHRRGMRGKRLLYDSFSDLLPNNIWFRRKQGFGVPIHQWFRADLGNHLKELMAKIDTPLQSHFIKEMLQAHQTGQKDHGSRLWNIYIYLLWRENRI